MAIVLTTHLLDDAEKLADYVYIIDQGRNATEGTVHQLAAENASSKSLTATYTEALPHELALPHWFQDFAVQVEEYGLTLHGELTPQHAIELIKFSTEQHFELQDLHFSAATLEDVYLEISGKEIR